MPRWLGVAFRVLGPVMTLCGVVPVESGKRVVFMASERFPTRGGKGVEGKGKVEVAVASDGVSGGGAYRVDWNGEIDPCPKSFKKLRDDGMGEKIWDHTMRVFEEIEAGEVFTDQVLIFSSVMFVLLLEGVELEAINIRGLIIRGLQRKI